MILDASKCEKLPPGKYAVRVDNRKPTKGNKPSSLTLQVKVCEKQETKDENDIFYDIDSMHVVDIGASETVSFVTYHGTSSLFISLAASSVFSHSHFFVQVFHDIMFDKMTDYTEVVQKKEITSVDLASIVESEIQEMKRKESQRSDSTLNDTEAETSPSVSSIPFITPKDSEIPVITVTAQKTREPQEKTLSPVIPSAQPETGAPESLNVRRHKRAESSIMHSIRRAVGKSQSIDVDNVHVDMGSNYSESGSEDDFEDCH